MARADVSSESWVNLEQDLWKRFSIRCAGGEGGWRGRRCRRRRRAGGHTEDGHNLGSWRNNQRAALAKGTITPEKVAELDAIDPAWRRGKLAAWEQENMAIAA